MPFGIDLFGDSHPGMGPNNRPGKDGNAWTPQRNLGPTRAQRAPAREASATETLIAAPTPHPAGGDLSARRTTRTKRLGTIETPDVTSRMGMGAQDRGVMTTVPVIARRTSEPGFEF